MPKSFSFKSIRQRGKTSSFELTITEKDTRTGEIKRLFRTIKAPNKRAAKKDADQLIAELNISGNAPDNELTVETLLAEALAVKANSGAIEESTVRTYISDGKLVCRDLGHVKVKDLTVDDVAGFVAGLVEAGYNPTTIKRAHGRLKSALKYAMSRGKVNKNVCDFVHLPKSEVKDRPVLSNDQRQRLFSAAFENIQNSSLRVAVFLGACTGMRRQEVCALRWSDFDAANGTVSVNRAIALGKGRTYVKETKTKGSKRTIPLPPRAVAIMSMLQAHEEGVLNAIGESDADPYIAGTWRKDSKYYDPTKLDKDFRVFCDCLGLPKDFRFHDLRHTMATYLVVEQNVDPVTAARILGHASPHELLNRYAEYVPQAARNAVAGLDDDMGFFGYAAQRETAHRDSGKYSVEELRRMLAEAEARERRLQQ